MDAGRAGAGDRFDFGRGAPWSSPKAAAVGQGSEELSSEGKSVILSRSDLTAMMAKHFPKVSFAISE